METVRTCLILTYRKNDKEHQKETPVTHLEEGHGGAVLHQPVLYLGLLGQVVGRVDGRLHALHGEEGRQVGRVGGDDDEGEEPPHAPHDAARQRPGRGAETRQT